MELVPRIVDGLQAAGAGDIPVVVGGIVPPGDIAALELRGVAAVFTPKDYGLTPVIDAIVTEIREAYGLD
jgi:(2R)-ethylmalonyl-CoA mutase